LRIAARFTLPISFFPDSRNKSNSALTNPRWLATGRNDMSKKVWIGAGLTVAALAWYALRPELIFVNKTVSGSFPVTVVAASAGDAVTAPRALATGRFQGYAHDTEETAAISMVEGKRLLRLADFMTPNGPDVHVYLVAAPDFMDDATVRKAGCVDLGSMKGNAGDQNYDVPAEADLNRYPSVTIWCARFNVNFGTAPQSPAF
jgi:hypothetical protein